MIIYRVNADLSVVEIETGHDQLELDRDLQLYHTWDRVKAVSTNDRSTIAVSIWVSDTGAIDGSPNNFLASSLASSLLDSNVELFGDAFITGIEDEEGETVPLTDDSLRLLDLGLSLMASGFATEDRRVQQ